MLFLGKNPTNELIGIEGDRINVLSVQAVGLDNGLANGQAILFEVVDHCRIVKNAARDLTMVQGVVNGVVMTGEVTMSCDSSNTSQTGRGKANWRWMMTTSLTHFGGVRVKLQRLYFQ